MPLVAPNAAFTLSALRRKDCYAALLLLFRKKSRLRSRKNNYRIRSVIFTSLDYQLFSVKRSSLRSERRRSESLLEEKRKF